MIGERIICIKERALDNRLKVGMQFTIKDKAYSPGVSFYKVFQTPSSSPGRDTDGNEYYVVASDSGEIIGWIESNYFRPLSEVRLDKLKELGI